jgi:hypothetical protein
MKSADTYSMRRRFFFVLVTCIVAAMSAQEAAAQEVVPPGARIGEDVTNPALKVNADDIIIEKGIEDGYHLYIRKKNGLGSVLLTESTRDPALINPNYAFRALEFNEVNGYETRILDGAIIAPERRIYSLIDSTPVMHPVLGDAFHIFIPYMLHFGYPDGRNGEIYVGEGTYLNIRTFVLPYADYRDAFRDNPFVFRFVQEATTERPDKNYSKEAEKTFEEVSEGPLVYSKGPEDLVDRIEDILRAEAGKPLDLVLCIDTTLSMKDDINAVRSLLIPMLEGIIKDYPVFRIGMVLYKDYFDSYLNQVIPFTSDFNVVKRDLNAISVQGGRDIPEAVYEAIHAGATKLPWINETRLMILIGDAPPHPKPRGKITKDAAMNALEAKNITLKAIILPN